MSAHKLQDQFTEIVGDQNRYRARKRAKGLCYGCTKKALDGKTRCADCLTLNKNRGKNESSG